MTVNAKENIEFSKDTFKKLVPVLCNQFGMQFCLHCGTGEIDLLHSTETADYMCLSTEENWTSLAGGDSEDKKDIAEAIFYYLNDLEYHYQATLEKLAEAAEEFSFLWEDELRANTE